MSGGVGGGPREGHPDPYSQLTIRIHYHIAGNNRFRLFANSEYPSIPKSVFSSITIRRKIAGNRIKRNTKMVTQLKKYMDIPAFAMIIPA
jgi:hypothetical protein